ncbi:tRNA pseudouridine synthase D [Phellopilus nigrolimitatus]|nr:tRNA pseudouridine synthase D [Phellopilus nigrolimitatus]
MSSTQDRVTNSDEVDSEEPQAKRLKLDVPDAQNVLPEQISSEQSMDVEQTPEAATETALDQAAEPAKITSFETLLPPSRVLLGTPPASHAQETSAGHTLEFDVGISEYISKDLPSIHAIIKQRFTDFLVHEVNLDGEVIHVTSLEMPQSEVTKQAEVIPEEANTTLEAVNPDLTLVPKTEEPSVSSTVGTSETEEKTEEKVEDARKEDDSETWPERFDTALSQYLSEPRIAQLKQMYLEGPEPPFVSDSGWGSRQAKPESAEAGPSQANVPEEKIEAESLSKNDRGKRGKRGRDRGGRGRGGARRGDRNKPVDPRKVISDPMESKTARTGLHKIIRELFGGKLESETDTKANADDDGTVVIKWGKRGQGRDAGRGGRGNKDDKPRGTYPPFIHFTLQKTNRDTQDALGHLSRILHCSNKDITVAGTKDKRGVTVQRVALRRGNKTVEDVWKMANGQNGRKTLEEALTQRGERGVRISDLKYRKAGLDLGMLKGNVFVITLRNVQVEPLDTIDRAMEFLKHKGFINYYGMQRFGTASIPTHSIGLAFLQSDWQKAASLILQHRPGEHPDVVAARDAWLVEKDLDKALQLLPRRVVAERCILESYKKMKGDTRNAMGALSTIPRTLRLMYVHAYQSYVWNAIVSERVRVHGADKPVAGDLVYEKEGEGGRVIEDGKDEDEEMPDAEEEGQSSKRMKRTWVAPRVKILNEEDVDKYTIFDVLIPLPGKDVAYPGGALGERYRKFLKLDGLDPDNLSSKHKDYNLSGSYRKIIHQPKELSWSVLRYTDPDVSLAQTDEDKLLGFEPPVVDENGKFVALQVELQLGTAAYATMALREVTKTETSSHYQTSLTQSSSDQAFRGTVGKITDEMEM